MFENMVSFISVYMIYSVALLFFSAYIFFHLSRDIATSTESFCFKMFILSFMGYSILDDFQVLREFDMIKISAGIYTAICFFTFLFIILNTLCFYLVATLHLGVEKKLELKNVIIGLVPLFVAIILLLISLVNGMIFSVDGNTKIVRGPSYFLIYICAFVYLAAIAGNSFSRIKTADTWSGKRYSIGMILFVMFLIVWAIIDTSLKGITTIPLLIFAVIFHLFISFQQSNIYTDTLTGMNNRRKAESYLSAELKSKSGEMPLYIFMGDINGFKEINDAYGHHEGDQALIIFAEAVKKSASAYNGFAARYGGDEFVWAWRPVKSGDFDPEMVIQDIRHRVAAECISKKKPYIISLSIGYVICEDQDKNATSYLKEADRKMYADKHGYYRTNGKNILGKTGNK